MGNGEAENWSGLVSMASRELGNSQQVDGIPEALKNIQFEGYFGFHSRSNRSR